MNNKLNIYGINLNTSWANKEENLLKLERELKIIPQDTDLVVLPEMFTTGFQTDNAEIINSLAEKNSGETIFRLQKLAEKYKTAIAGTFLAKSNTKFYNRAFFIEPSGEYTYYDKHHLFTMANEDKFYSAGEKLPPIIRYRGWNIMPIICYDLRFPVWCRNVNRKYDMLLVLANWPKVRLNAWEILLKARAIENQCYVCGINRTGVDNNNIEFPSNGSFIIDYKGNSISNNLNVNIIASLDKESLENYLKKFPTWKDDDEFSLSTSLF